MVRLLATKEPKLVRIAGQGTYVQLGNGVRTLVARPDRTPNEEILKAYGLQNTTPVDIEATDDPHFAGDPDDEAGGEEPEGEPTEFPHHKGGGHWQLSDGTEVGPMKRAEAEEAEAALHHEE